MMRRFLNWLQNDTGGLITFVCFVISIIMIIVSFILPPTGVIDSSVLSAVGELGIFSTLLRIPDLIEKIKDGKSVELRKGDASIKVEDKK